MNRRVLQSYSYGAPVVFTTQVVLTLDFSNCETVSLCCITQKKRTLLNNSSFHSREMRSTRFKIEDDENRAQVKHTRILCNPFNLCVLIIIN